MQQSSQCSLPMSAYVKGRGLGFLGVFRRPAASSSASSLASEAGFCARNHLHVHPCSAIRCK